jgi:serine/threonine protein kinase
MLIDHTGQAKLADFGLAHVGDSTAGMMSQLSGAIGTIRWAAPERFSEADIPRLTPGVDVYGFACLIYMARVHVSGLL